MPRKSEVRRARRSRLSALGSAIQLAFGALRRNQMRALLTSLGVIIGVSALIVTVASGEGAKAVLQEQLATLGTNRLVVLSGSSTAGGVRGGTGTGRPLTVTDLRAIIKGANAVRYAAPIDRGLAQVVLDNRNWLTPIIGSTPEFFAIRQWKLARGRSFNANESDSGVKVCVLGQTTTAELFGAASPLGQMVRVGSMPCQVIGVLERRGQSPQGEDQDDVIVMPWVAFKSRLMNQGRINVGSILISAISQDEISHAGAQVRGILRQTHRLSDNEVEDFTVRNLADVATVQKKAADAQTSMLRNVAAVSLLVGGIGIMNIMLVSVTERTREIGIRLAIGASESKVMLQFLIEAVVLSAAGGVIGVVLGVGAALALASTMGWPFVLTPLWIFMAFATSMLIGVLFGFYPARKAAQMNPIDALRFE
jgi:putative ABC transport system permease protein